MAALTLAFDILAKDKASKEFNKVGDAAEKTGGKAKKLGLALAGVAAAGAAGLFAVLKGGAAEFADNQQAMAQFEAGLKSTGNVAGITGDQMKALADSIEAKTGTDGAAVVSGGALLATFTNVRNELGKGNDVFTRATQAGVDLAARGFGTVETNAISLGKALNDPIKGITALGKQGVSFTEGQKKLIKSLVESGNTLDAQKIILKAVEEQVGGSAEAYGKTLPGQLARARAAFDGVKETVFTAVLPAVTKLLEFVTAKMIPSLQKFADVHGPAVVGAFRSVASFVTGTVVPALQSFGEWVNRNKDFLIPFVATIATVVGAYKLYVAIQKTVIAVTAAWNAVLALNPIGLVIILIAGLVAGLVVAYKRSETFRDIVNGALAAVKGAFISMATAALGVIDKLLGGYQALAAAAGKLPGPLGAPFRAAADAIGKARQGVANLQSGINSLKGKKVTVEVTTIRTEIQRTIVQGQRAVGKGNIPGFASGVRNFAGGFAVVGENGPELTYLPPRSNVYSNAESKQMLAREDGRGGNTTIIQTAAQSPAEVFSFFKRMETLYA